ncbi:histidine kinase [Nocardia amikacinitolerans]|uniref:histidine kinase n=1 Tax=Nocardia amikacinitolerans TaxID=756689 RepID=UPI000A94A67D|nr:histidine kinase [Nocardia amikacinitolerans]
MSAPGIANRGSVVWDWGLALIVAVVQVAGGRGANLHQTGTQSLDVLGYLLLIAGPVALAFRRVQPLPVLVIALAACGIYLALGYGYGPIFVSLVIAFLTAGTIGSRWWTYPLVPIGFVLFVWPLPASLGESVNGWQVFGMLAWSAVLIGAAEGLRQRQATLEARKEREEAARRDEQAQRERRATEERLAIARELHDVLAHSLSLINVQSSVALELFDKRPQQARTALAAIKAASKESLAEVHSLLQTIRMGATLADPETAPVQRDSTEAPRPARGLRGLRRAAPSQRRVSGTAEPGKQPEDLRAAVREPRSESRPAEPPKKQEAPRPPAPSIGDLDALLRRPREAGLTVETRVIGEPQTLPSEIDAVAAQIVQESLTNVVRHAPGASATVTVRYAVGSVDLTIDNARPTAPALRSGSGGRNGIIGMRERAHALGGALTAGPRPSGGFRVAARLPSQTVPVPARPAPRTAEVAASSGDGVAEKVRAEPDNTAEPLGRNGSESASSDNADAARGDRKGRNDTAPGSPGSADAAGARDSSPNMYGSTGSRSRGSEDTAPGDRKSRNDTAPRSPGSADTAGAPDSSPNMYGSTGSRSRGSEDTAPGDRKSRNGSDGASSDNSATPRDDRKGRNGTAPERGSTAASALDGSAPTSPGDAGAATTNPNAHGGNGSSTTGSEDTTPEDRQTRDGTASASTGGLDTAARDSSTHASLGAYGTPETSPDNRGATAPNTGSTDAARGERKGDNDPAPQSTGGTDAAGAPDSSAPTVPGDTGAATTNPNAHGGNGSSTTGSGDTTPEDRQTRNGTASASTGGLDTADARGSSAHASLGAYDTPATSQDNRSATAPNTRSSDAARGDCKGHNSTAPASTGKPNAASARDSSAPTSPGDAGTVAAN